MWCFPGCSCVLLALICSLVCASGKGDVIASHKRKVRQTFLGLCDKGSTGGGSASCVDCFCNGFSDSCLSATGWFQAQVGYSSSNVAEMSRFSTNGIKEQSEKYLSVRSSSSEAVYLSFPPEFLGDKRTAYGQSLSLNLSLGGGDALPPQCQVTLELESGLSFRTRHKLRTSLPPVGQEPTEIEIPLTAGSFVLDRYYFRRQANRMDVRKTLADIRAMRLTLACDQPRSLRLHSFSLNFATTNSSTDGPAEQPLEEVGYVERCSCPSNRVGANCETCADGYTTDPPFGGEFALCVRCFCSFQSSSCDPLSGVCVNCTGNTMGRDCEQCVDGYDRAQPLTILPCDRCVDGYWDSGDGVCTPCSCHLAGSSSPVCDQTSGSCACAEGFSGDRCDSCSTSSSGTFPNCQPCDECTEQWTEQITSLEEQVGTTIDFITSLNLTNETSIGVAPEIEELLALVADIKAALNGSMIDSLASDVNSTHSLICSLLDRALNLLQRAVQAEGRIQSLEPIPDYITQQLELLRPSLLQLDMEFGNLSLIFAQENISTTVNYDEFVQLARTALERSDVADRIFSVNITTLFSQIATSLELYNNTLISSNFESTLVQLDETVATIDSRVQLYRTFIAESNRALCGADNSTEVNCTLDCGGVSCDTCGGTSCSSLYSDSITALNNSLTAVDLAEEALGRIQEQLDNLQSFLVQVELGRSSASQVVESANATIARGMELLGHLQILIARLEGEVNRSRTDPDEIGRRENFTLSLQHDLTPEVFLDLLIEINSTIEAFFSQANVSEVDLRRRVEEALQRALRADELAQSIVSNATALEDELMLLSAQQVAAEIVANDTQQLVEQAEETTGEAVQILDGTEGLVGSLGSLLTGLDARLDSLQTQIEQNLRDLALARNLTTIAVRVANQTETDSLSAEEQVEVLRKEAQRQYSQSVEDLQSALGIQNRTIAVQKLTQNQLLQLENLVRIRTALFLEQEEIRADVGRVGNELEMLDQTIRVHIARNTACLDTGILSKKKRRRRSFK